jgi:hypothetical protein
MYVTFRNVSIFGTCAFAESPDKVVHLTADVVVVEHVADDDDVEVPDNVITAVEKIFFDEAGFLVDYQLHE